MTRTTSPWTVALAAAFAIASSASLATAQGHPHFNDGGTLAWFTTLDSAKAAARKANKLIFLEVGAQT
jgi:hypothetical protein